jgi:hypothetical protein
MSMRLQVCTLEIIEVSGTNFMDLVNCSINIINTNALVKNENFTISS